LKQNYTQIGQPVANGQKQYFLCLVKSLSLCSQTNLKYQIHLHRVIMLMRYANITTIIMLAAIFVIRFVNTS